MDRTRIIFYEDNSVNETLDGEMGRTPLSGPAVMRRVERQTVGPPEAPRSLSLHPHGGISEAPP